MKQRPTWMYSLSLLVIVSTALAGCGPKGGGDDEAKSGKAAGVGQPGGPVPVDVTTVSLGSLEKTIPVTGSLAALQDVQLSAKQAGRVVTVTVREGDTVHAGQLIVQQDVSDLQANVRQAQANVASAQAKVSQALTAYNIQVTQAKQGVLNAQALLRQSQQNYLKAQRGSRPQEVLQAESAVISAEANMKNALTNLKRQQSLYSQGAVAKADLDTAQTTYDVDVAQYKNAEAALSLTKAGNRQEDIAAAYAQVQQQQTNLKNAIANVNLISSKRDDIRAAQAAVAQAQAALAYDQVQVKNASIVSPISGIVASRAVDPGQIASPGTNLVRIVNVGSVYYQPTVSETDIQQASVGKSVNVQVDAFPGRTFTGRVVALYPAANTTNRNFTLRVAVPNPNSTLRPGMFARGQIVAEAARNVPVIPSSALVPDSSSSGFASNTSSNASVGSGSLVPKAHVAVVMPNDRVQLRPVQVGIATQDQVQIVSGLKAGDRIVTVGQTTLKSGDKIAVQTQPKEAMAASNS